MCICPPVASTNVLDPTPRQCPYCSTTVFMDVRDIRDSSSYCGDLSRTQLFLSGYFFFLVGIHLYPAGQNFPGKLGTLDNLDSFVLSQTFKSFFLTRGFSAVTTLYHKRGWSLFRVVQDRSKSHFRNVQCWHGHHI